MSEPSPPAGTIRRLRRSRTDRVLGGVCGGLGEYLGVDAALVRIAAVLLVFAGGAGIVAYLVAWILIPEAAEGEETGPGRPAPPGRARTIAGAVLVGVGALLLVDMLIPIRLEGRFVWPILLIVVGAAVILRGERS
jgi:phage shock protein C